MRLGNKQPYLSAKDTVSSHVADLRGVFDWDVISLLADRRHNLAPANLERGAKV